MKRRLYLLTILSTLLLSSCFNTGDPPADAPANVTATAGEGLVALEWDVLAGHTYWVFYKAGATVSQTDYDSFVFKAQSPLLVTGLTNTTQYAFSLTSTRDGSEFGPYSAPVTATPRLLSPAVPWTVGTSLTTSNLNDIAFGFSLYAAVGDAATIFSAPYDYTSTGGITGWTQATTLPVAAGVNITAIIVDTFRFIALGDDGSVMVNTSADLLTWEAVTAITTPPLMNDLTVQFNTYVAVGNNGAIYTNDSSALTNAWVQQTSNTTNNLQSVAYVFDQFIAVGDAGTLLTSPDGIVWTPRTSNAANTLRAVSYGAGLYVAVGDAGEIVTSPDAITWTAQTPLAGGASLRDIVFGADEQFIAVGTAGTVAYSATGLDGSWTTATEGSIDLNALVNNLVFIAVGDAGSNISGK